MKLLLVVLCAFVGVALADRLPYIVGGKDVDHAGKYPWQASLQTRGWIFGGQHICGASLVSKTWLVTAAHCVQGQSPSGLQIVMGLHDKDTKRKGDPETYFIKRLIGHPGFGRGGRAMPNDIALIQLAEGVNLDNKFVSTIQMADHMENFEGNKECFITGWGTLVGGGRTPNVLQEANIDVWDLPSCNRAHGITGISNQQVCVGKKGQSGGCHGDSGGPLVCKVGATWKLVGATSWGKPTCSPNYPTIYSSVAYFRPWIKQHSGL